MNPNDLAFPSTIDIEGRVNNRNVHCKGLSKREYFIGQALAGLCANPDSTNMTEKTIGSLAITQADALIELLKDEKK